MKKEKKIAWVSQYDHIKETLEKMQQEEKFREIEKDNFMDSFSPLMELTTGPSMIPVQHPNAEFMEQEVWWAHTNFALQPNHIQAIYRVEGVSAVEKINKYTFKIGIGQLFEFKDVRQAIQSILCDSKSTDTILSFETNDSIYELPDELQNKVDRIKKKLSQKYKYWAIFVFPNGKIEVAIDNSLSEKFMNKLTMFDITLYYVGGSIFSSSDCQYEQENGASSNTQMA